MLARTGGAVQIADADGEVRGEFRDAAPVLGPTGEPVTSSKSRHSTVAKPPSEGQAQLS